MIYKLGIINMINLNKHLAIFALSIASAYSAYGSTAYENNKESDRVAYVGVEAGLSKTLKKTMPIETEFGKGKDLTLEYSKSNTYSIKGGYSFYPEMALEFAANIHPKYKVDIKFPELPFLPERATGKNSLKLKFYTLSAIYNLPRIDFAGVTPYVLGGAGVAEVKIMGTKVYGKLPPLGELALLDVMTTNNKLPAYQLGLGLRKDITHNVELDLSAKMQLIPNVKVKYRIFDKNKFDFGDKKHVKKHLGVGYIALGLNFKLPY